ncbi:LysR substrate-binding domain-containing protein [Paraburkholderia sp. ZP32-5]|uniref:LysR substrate-binding domain-containing protein n=1 Tax=Paraburkholderia sp. ZP32-5 TaxID=2883245 RepID=UPI001F491B2C|nr:LysR substrate-binding domain-containing protein [Paraburkholderia sp. ZP32-5]
MSVVEQHLLARLRARHLALLVALADTLSIHRAADRLHMTQPAASKALRELEELFGTRLFERYSHGLRPTAATQIVIDHARIMLSEMQKLGGDLELLANGAQGKVRVGIMPVAIPGLLTRVLALMDKEAPRVVTEFHEGALDWMLAGLAQGKLDCIVGRLGEGTAAAPFCREVLFEEDVCIVARAGHPLAKRKKITPAMLAAADWIFPGADAPLRASIRSFFADCQIPSPIPKVESVSVLVNLQVLQETDWLAFLPHQIAVEYQKLGVLAVLEALNEWTMPAVGLVTRAETRPAPALQIFAQLVRRVGEEIGELRGRE